MFTRHLFLLVHLPQSANERFSFLAVAVDLCAYWLGSLQRCFLGCKLAQTYRLLTALQAIPEEPSFRSWIEDDRPVLIVITLHRISPLQRAGCGLRLYRQGQPAGNARPCACCRKAGMPLFSR